MTDQEMTMRLEMLKQNEPRAVQECIDELERELYVRIRCFDRWVQDGRLTRTDARDRTERHYSAMVHLAGLLSAAAAADTEQPSITSSGDKTKKPF